MNKDEALTLALDFIERANKDACMLADYEPEIYDTITAIKVAIAQPEPPIEADQLLVALHLDPYTYRTDGGWLNIPKILAAIKSPEDYPHLEREQRQWVGLTRREFWEATSGLEDLEDCWLAIEAKLKEKNT